MADESALKTKVLAAASKNTCLLLRLSSLSEAPSTLHNHIIAVSRLQEELSRQTTAIDKLKSEANTLLAAHKKFQESKTQRIFRRPAHKNGSLERDALKAEQEYFAVLSARSKAQERQVQLQRHHEESLHAQRPLEKAVGVYEEVCRELDDLYGSVFAGPTPGFPHEDEQEAVVNVARSENEATKDRIRKAREAKRWLNLAQEYLERAGTCFRNAQQRATTSKLFLGYAVSTFTVGAKRVGEALDAFFVAEEHMPPHSPQMLQTKEAFVENLQALQAISKDLGSRKIILSAVTTAQKTLPEAEARLKELIEAMKGEERAATFDLETTVKRLEDARQELQQVRQEIFEAIAGFGQAAPAYGFIRPKRDCCHILEEGYDTSELEKELELEVELAERNVLPKTEGVEPPGYEDGINIPRSSLNGISSVEIWSGP